MKKFFARVGRFFWSWGFLKFVLVVVTLVVLLYVEEDWRGARMWAATKAKWEGQGETFDINRFTPAPVSEGENLGAISLMKLTPRVLDNGNTFQEATALDEATKFDFPHGDLPMGSQWTKGKSADMPAIREEVAGAFAKKFPGTVPPASAVAQFEALFPFVNELQTESARRPLFQLLGDFSIQPPASRSLGSVTAQIKVVRILALHALLALDERKPDVALADFTLISKLAKGVWRDPTLVAGLVGIGMMAIADGVASEGLNNHEWNDAQLREIEALQGRFDYLAEYQFTFRNTAAEAIANIDYFQHSPRNDMVGLLTGMSEQSDANHIRIMRWPFAVPSGWWGQNRVLLADYILGAVRLVDPKLQRAYPEKLDEMVRRDDAQKARWDAGMPWRVWFSMMAGPLQYSVVQFSYAQARSDEMRIACALERYRLAQGHYPEALDDLVPEYIDVLPRDVLKGEPYRYRVNADGTFVLYCVGWSGVDHGGTLQLTKEKPMGFDYYNGDWIWPIPTKAK